MISPSDTISIFPLDRQVVGRIIDVEPDQAVVSHSSIPLHPSITLPRTTAHPFLKMQLIITKEQSLNLFRHGANWPILPADILRATLNLKQAAHTNCLVWISPDQISDLIAVYHTSHCINHTFGALAGRKNAYFTCSHAIFDHQTDNEDVHHSTEVILPSDYHIFGKSMNGDDSQSSFVTETERNVEF